MYCPAAVFAASKEASTGVPAAVLVTVVAAVPAVALVKVDVVRVVEVTRATFPDPVDASQDATVPLDVRNVLAPPIVVSPRSVSDL